MKVHKSVSWLPVFLVVLVVGGLGFFATAFALRLSGPSTVKSTPMLELPKSSQFGPYVPHGEGETSHTNHGTPSAPSLGSWKSNSSRSSNDVDTQWIEIQRSPEQAVEKSIKDYEARTATRR